MNKFVSQKAKKEEKKKKQLDAVLKATNTSKISCVLRPKIVQVCVCVCIYVCVRGPVLCITTKSELCVL